MKQINTPVRLDHRASRDVADDQGDISMIEKQVSISKGHTEEIKMGTKRCRRCGNCRVHGCRKYLLCYLYPHLYR